MTPPASGQIGLVIAAHGRRGKLEDSDGGTRPYLVRSRQLRVVCGDRVRWQDAADGPVTVTSVSPRRNALRRLGGGRHGPEILAANLSLLVAVCAPLPQPDWFVLDRYLCAAADMNAAILIAWNKCELDARYSAELSTYRNAGYAVLEVSARTGVGLQALARKFAAEIGILVGQSGVGKSSLINRLVRDAEVDTASLSRGTGEGRHTTTASVMHQLPDGGRLIDTPGVRDFVPALSDPAAVQAGFPEIVAAGAACRFANCRHLREPGCAVKAAVAAAAISARRYESYRRLLRQSVATESG